MKGMMLIGVAVLAVAIVGCASSGGYQQEKRGTPSQLPSGGLYSALDATAQVYTHPMAQAPLQDHWFRWVAFVTHPVGLLLDYAVNRPVYALAEAFPTFFGFTSEDAMVNAQRTQ